MAQPQPDSCKRFWLPAAESRMLTFIIPKLLISPIKGPPVLENASVKPQKVHWKVMTAMTDID